MIRIAHESPKSIFKEVQKSTDYDYFLVHLFEEDEEYFRLAQESVSSGREVILDNSIFELGTAFDSDRFAYWIEKLKPTWYIIPDVLENYPDTVNNFHKWNEKYGSLPGKKIGVVQGSSYEDIRNCYTDLNKSQSVDMIAISFDYSYYRTLFPHPNKYVSWMLGRVLLLGRLLEEGIINTERKHHLLGSSLPQEGTYYRESNFDWIYSMDTSNPCVHGIKGVQYGNEGLWNKESQKLFEMINTPIEEIDLELVQNNIQRFRYFWNGE